MSVRQTERLLNRYRDGGGGALIHKARGRTSNYQLSTGVREYALELIRKNYRDFGPTFAAEVLLDRHELRVSRETLRRRSKTVWAVAQAAPELSSAAPATRELGRVDPDRRQRSPLVRGPRRSVYAAGLHRRCHEQADAAALRGEREHGLLLRSACAAI